MCLSGVGGQVQLSVADHGTGIRAAERDAVVAPFRRTTEARERGSGGSGLGLYITHRLVTARGRSIAAEDTPGGGTAALVRFRRAPAVDETSSASDPAQALVP